jgi:class 3 adenylate cyclase/tetratricopeptide (TPR) repeat protein
MAVCPNCGEDNPGKARFCMVCATRLEQTPQPQAEERKVVSVLFVDLVGFTARSHDADPEDVRAALQPYHQRLKREIEIFGGTVEKFIGDAVMAVYGAPVSHEDDAERAVRAALRITEAIQELNEEADLGLSIRAAVNTGEGLVNLSARPQSGEGMVTGDVVNTASRLQRVAPVNGIVVGEITYRSTKASIVYEAMDSVSVKGKPDPVPVWRTVSARGRFGVDVETRYKTPFIGRHFDLATLKTAFQRTLREDSLQLLTVVGEPGVGKTRLLAEFSSYVDEQPELVTWRQGRSLPYGEGITFWALGEIVKAQAGINESDSPQVATAKVATAVGAVVGDEADRAWLQTRLAPLVGATSVGGTADKEESFTAWLRFLEAIATKGPLVLVFEDLHWADAALLEFIEHIVEWSSGVPILIIASARPELFEHRPGWGAGTRNATTISLSPLTDAETTQLLSALLSEAVLPAEMHATLLERAGGNPLYAEEFIRMLFDSGLLQQGGRLRTIDPSVEIPMPDNIQALIAARLDTLTPERKSLLHSAAVVGKVFWSGALESLEVLDEQALRRSLQELVRKELIRPARTSSIEGQQEYSFWHALISDVAYRQIPRRQCADKHAGVAGWLEGVAGERVADHAEVLAHHYESALELLSASRMTDRAAEMVEPTVRFLVLAAERAKTLNPTVAGRHYEKALGLMFSEDPSRSTVILGLAEVLRFAGQFQDSISLAEEALRLSRTAGDQRTEGRALICLSLAYWYMGRGTEARDFSAKAIATHEQVEPAPELAKAYLQASELALFEGHLADGLDWADKALTVAEQLGSPGDAIRARASRAAARSELGEEKGLDDLLAAYEDALAWGDEAGVSDIGGWLAAHLWWIEGPESGLQLYEEVIARAEQRGLASDAMQGRAEALWMRYDLGEWDRVLDEGRQILLYSEDRQDKATEVAALPTIARVLAWREHLEEASVLCERLLPLARDMRDLQTLAPALATCAQVAQMRGEHSAAVELVEELDQATRQTSGWGGYQLPTALRILIVADELDRAENFVRGLEVFATQAVNFVLTGRAILAEARGDIAEASTLYQEASQRWADYGLVLEEGQAHLGLARCLIVLGDREAAIEPLKNARAIFSRLGAVPLLGETDGYLQQAQAAS